MKTTFSSSASVVEKCANCGNFAFMKCSGYIDAPKYETGEPTSIVYCNGACHNAHWPDHRANCNIRQRRKKLLRSAIILRATLLAYRDCAFDIPLKKIEFRDGVLHLYEDYNHGLKSPQFFPFPSHLIASVEYKEAALTENQCTLAMALLDPLTRALLQGVCTSITARDILVGKPRYKTNRVLMLTDKKEVPHTILVCELRNKERWVIDAAGCQYGFRDNLRPLGMYMRENDCQDLNMWQTYTATETKDLDYFQTLPIMTHSAYQRARLANERTLRVQFAAFVQQQIDRSQGAYGKEMLLGTAEAFETRVDAFATELIVYMTQVVNKMREARLETEDQCVAYRADNSDGDQKNDTDCHFTGCDDEAISHDHVLFGNYDEEEAYDDQGDADRYEQEFGDFIVDDELGEEIEGDELKERPEMNSKKGRRTIMI